MSFITNNKFSMRNSLKIDPSGSPQPAVFQMSPYLNTSVRYESPAVIPKYAQYDRDGISKTFLNIGNRSLKRVSDYNENNSPFLRYNKG